MVFWANKKWLFVGQKLSKRKFLVKWLISIIYLSNEQGENPTIGSSNN